MRAARLFRDSADVQAKTRAALAVLSADAELLKQIQRVERMTAKQSESSAPRSTGRKALDVTAKAAGNLSGRVAGMFTPVSRLSKPAVKV